MYNSQQTINVWNMVFLPVFTVLVLSGTVSSAQGNAPATPPVPAQGGVAVENWRSKVGAAVAAPETIKTVMASVPAEDRLVFVQELMTAAAAVPGDANARLAIIKAVAINCIASVGVDSKVAVISEVIASVPVTYLPHVCSELAARFAPQVNNLTTSQFQAVGEQVIQKVVERVAGSDDVNVRTACAISCFLTGTVPENDPLLPALMAKVPASDAVKPAVVQSLAVSVASGDAAPVYAAANVTPVVTTPLVPTTTPAPTQQQATTTTTGQQQGTTTTTQQQPAAGASEGGITLNTPLPSYLAVSGHSSQDGLLMEFGSSSTAGSGQTASGSATGASGTGSTGTGTSSIPEGIQVVPVCSSTNVL
jgi:hypothetical protein